MSKTLGLLMPRKTTGWSEKGDIMKIIEYEDKYLEEVKDLLVELEEYILSIDEDNLDQYIQNIETRWLF